MFNEIAAGLICLLAVYGALAIIIGIVEGICFGPQRKCDNVRLVLVVRNAGDNIEWIVRNIFRHDFQGKALSGINPAVVDLDSADDTFKILTKLKKEYPLLDIYPGDEKERIFTEYIHLGRKADFHDRPQ